MAVVPDSMAPAQQRPETLCLRGLRSLQFKASLLIVMLILLVSTAGMTLSLQSTRSALFENESRRAYSWAVSLAASEATEVGTRNREALLVAANNLIRMHGVAYVAFSDREGRLLASAESAHGLLHGVTRPEPAPTGSLNLEPVGQPRLETSQRHAISYVDVVVPVLTHAATVRPDQPSRSLVGYLRFAADISESRAQLKQITAELVRMTVCVVLLVVPCSLLATRRVVRPVHDLARAARAVADGSLDARAPVHADDEIGELARVFNLMVERVGETQRDLRELNVDLEKRVLQRTRDLEEQAARDPLTGLYNRRHFSEVITREFAAAERYSQDLTCLMFDIDHFKEVNDRFGHRAGDHILIALARAIMAELRSSDVGARFGGDEFILLLPQTPAAQASSVADRIVLRFAENAAVMVPEASPTLSIGVASLRTTRACSAEALIHESDVALYAAKEGGRNRTMQAAAAGA